MSERASYQISVKGLYRDESGKILIIRDKYNRFELPGGSLEVGEDVLDCLHRECLEEIGVKIEILDTRPISVWFAETTKGNIRLIILYKIKPLDFNFIQSDEALEVKMVTREELNKVELVPQLLKLKEII